MTEDEFIKRWHADRPMYEAWGNFVVDRIVETTQDKIVPVSVGLFLRIPPKPRLKADGSLLEKAFYRGKPYADPYQDITDKVGARFVVLLTGDIKTIEEAIGNCKEWDASKDRDFEEEQKLNPVQFEYAAVHYVVRANSEISIGNIIVTKGTPCEVQVKTILQHAYSELTHDTIYKPKVTATALMKRTAAKSMALIEATNDYFTQVVEQVAASLAPDKALTNELSPIYSKYVKREPELTRAESLILEAYGDIPREGLIGAIIKFLDANSFVAERIGERANAKLLYRQPAILLVYFLASRYRGATKAKWPLTADELRPIYVDLGLNFDAL
ncbi:RelA/SpoT family protein [Mesorhizobium sp. M00.F.Ca.ET.151.01.1.1]|nr:RelA/SpoT family protein [Mesorhizobium sp. M00.F.Ca.ET.151.01.1.1]